MKTTLLDAAPVQFPSPPTNLHRKAHGVLLRARGGTGAQGEVLRQRDGVVRNIPHS